MNRKDIEKYLYNALQPDDAIRREAELKITEFQSLDYNAFLLNIVSIFTDQVTPKQLKMISGIILKNSLHTSDYNLQTVYEKKWLSVDSNIRENIKTQIISKFNESDVNIACLSGSIFGFIARIEMPKNLFLNFFTFMEKLSIDNTQCISVFEAISVCCESLCRETNFVFNNYSQIIYNTCVYKLEDQSVNALIKEASLKCLMCCFKAISYVFEDQKNTLRFLSGISQTASTSLDLNIKALICLNKFVFAFYKYINFNIKEIMSYFNSFWNSSTDEILVQVVEFWTIVAEKNEDDIFKHVDSLLLNVLRLLKKNEDYVDQNWNAHKASAYLLEILTENYKNKILLNPIVFNFITSELQSENKERIDIGAIALGCVVSKNCDQQIVNFVKILINMMNDLITEESCLWALAKICETNFFAVIEHLSLLIKKTCEIISVKKPTSTNAAWIINSIFVSLNKIKDNKLATIKFSLEQQNSLKKYAVETIAAHFTYILQILIQATENANLEDSTLRVALFAAISELVRFNHSENSLMIDELAGYCAKKMDECINALNKASHNYFPIIEDVLSNYVTLSETIIEKRKKPAVEIFLPAYINILKSKPSSATGEVYLALTSNINEFIMYIDSFSNFILRDLTCLDMFILKSNINFIGCVSNVLQVDFFNYSTKIIPLLIQNLSSKNVSKTVKSQVLSVLGDIALAIGVNYDQYLDMSTIIFQQIVGLDRNSDEQYIDELRNNSLQMFDCIIIATCESQKLREIMYKLVEGIKILIRDKNSDSTLISLINLLSDLQNIFGNLYDLNGEWVTEFYYKYSCSENKDLKCAAEKAINR